MSGDMFIESGVLPVTLTPILVACNAVSLILLVPVILAYHPRGPLPTPLVYFFAIGLFFRHINSLGRFLAFGPTVEGAPAWYCILRKGMIVYISKAGIYFAAFFAFRLWVVVCATPGNRLVRKYDIEWWMTALAVGIPIIPALISTVPQVVAPPPVMDTTIPFVCKSGMIRQWQVFAVGAPLTVLPALLAIYCMVSILRRRLLAPDLTWYRLISASPSPGMSIRVLLITVANVVNAGYYSTVETERFFQLPPGGAMSQTYVRTRVSLDLGDVLVSSWGMITFLIFGTTRETFPRILGVLGRRVRRFLRGRSGPEEGEEEGEEGLPRHTPPPTPYAAEGRRGSESGRWSGAAYGDEGAKGETPPAEVEEVRAVPESSVVVPRRRLSRYVRVPVVEEEQQQGGVVEAEGRPRQATTATEACRTRSSSGVSTGMAPPIWRVGEGEVWEEGWRRYDVQPLPPIPGSPRVDEGEEASRVAEGKRAWQGPVPPRPSAHPRPEPRGRGMAPQQGRKVSLVAFGMPASPILSANIESYARPSSMWSDSDLAIYGVEVSDTEEGEDAEEREIP